MFTSSLSLIIPFYNERQNLGPVLADSLAFMRAHVADFEIVLIDDGSRDGSTDMISDAGETRVIRHEANRGLTAALRTGFFAAKKDVITWLPADGQIPLSELGKMLAAYRGEELLLSTYRHRPDGLVRRLMSKTVRVLVQLATGFSHRLEGPYLFRRELLAQLRLVSRTSAGSIGLEIGAKTAALGKTIGSVEIECAPRMSGRSKVANFRNVATYVQEVWRIGRSMRDDRRR